MQYSRNDYLVIHRIHTINASSSQEAAEKYKKEILAATGGARFTELVPEYSNMQAVGYLPEQWSEHIVFEDEDGIRYGWDGKVLDGGKDEK